MNKVEKKPGFILLLGAPAVLACLEILWNMPLSRLPIYWLPAYTPLCTVFLNSILHIAITVVPVALGGFLLWLLIRRRWVVPLFLQVAAAFYLFYTGCTVLSRLLSLNEFIEGRFSSGSYWQLTLGSLLLTGLLFSICLYFSRFLVRGGKTIAWYATLFLSMVVSIGAICLRWPLAPYRNLALAALLMILVHAGGWFLTRCYRLGFARIVTVLLVGTLALAILRGGWGTIGKEPNRPHLVVLVWDTARADRMSVYGYGKSTTPQTEKLADHALVFTQAHSTANFTFPSHVGIFTGMYNREHGLGYGKVDDLLEYARFEVLAESLRERGYRTLLVTENIWVITMRKDFQLYFWADRRGVPFNTRHGPLSHLKATPSRLPPFFLNCPSPFFLRQLLDNLQYWRDGYYKLIIDRYLLRALQEQLVLRKKSQPLFFFLNWMNIHNRYHPYRIHPVGETIAPYDISGEYDLAVQHADARFQELLDVFRRAGEMSRTVFVLTSDHGELLGEYELYGHRMTMFEPVLHVPLIIAHEPWSGRRTIESPVTLASLKNALEMLADNGPDSKEIIDKIVAIFRGAKGVVAEHRSAGPDDGGQPFQSFCYLGEDGIKISYDGELPYLRSTWGDNTTYFMFDLSRDPGETGNLFGSHPDMRERVWEQYEKWKKEVPAARPVPQNGEYPRGLEERLRAMGYIQ